MSIRTKISALLLSILGTVNVFAQQDIDEIYRSSIKFLGEHDGEPERILKNKLVPALSQHKEVQAAYLVVVSYPDTNELGVSLCIDSIGGNENKIVQSVSEVFSSIFHKSQALDILFINDDQRLNIKKVAKPFYESS